MYLTLTDIPNFKKWLIQNHWVLKETKGKYEIIRAHNNRYILPLIVFRKKDDTVTVPKNYQFLLKGFYDSICDYEDTVTHSPLITPPTINTFKVFDIVTKSPDDLVAWLVTVDAITESLGMELYSLLISPVNVYEYDDDDDDDGVTPFDM